MCAIIGWINLKEVLTGSEAIVAEMSAKLAARGPDSSGAWNAPHALLAHRRLAVMDPAGGSQPMTGYKGEYPCTLVYNGELYNAPELKKELEGCGYVFSTSCDTEVLLNSYLQWGPDCVGHLNGIFAFGVWDEKEQRLFLARDPFGVKPLFYAHLRDSLLFASEIKALLIHPDIQVKIGVEGLSEIFALGPAKTPGVGVFCNVSELKPAHCMLFDSQGIHLRRYWSLQSHEHKDGPETTIATIRALVTDSIERQFASDVPLCTFLSGGLDSSLISVLAAKHFREKGKGPLNTYSIDYKENEKYFVPSLYQPDPDAPWVKKMADVCGSVHHYITVDSLQVADALENATAARDLPGMADIDSSLWLFCKEVRKDAVVALSGECADEVFGGYPWFHREELMNTGTFPWARSTDLRTAVMSDDLIRAVRPEEYIFRRYTETLSEVPVLHGEGAVARRRRELFYLNFAWFMQTLLDRKDRMSMAHGLEVRVPYSDYRLVQYVWNIPWELKMLAGREKGLLRKAMEGILPDDVLYRKKSPYPKTHHPSYEKCVKQMLLEILHDPNSPLIPLVNKRALLKMLQEDSSPGNPFFGQLMALPQLYGYLIQINQWLRLYRISICP